MTLIDFDKKELHDIYSALSYTRLETGFENESEVELYDRLTKLMDKVAKLQEEFGHLYVITDTGEELSDGWESTGEVEEV